MTLRIHLIPVTRAKIKTTSNSSCLTGCGARGQLGMGTEVIGLGWLEGESVERDDWKGKLSGQLED